MSIYEPQVALPMSERDRSERLEELVAHYREQGYRVIADNVTSMRLQGHRQETVDVSIDVYGNISTQINVGERRRRSRRIIGGIAAAALMLEFVLAVVDVASASDQEASAVQIIQVWVPHLFYAMTIIGLTIAAYIFTRADS